MSNSIAIVDYGMGNVGSVINMIKRVGGTSRLTGDPDEVAAARQIILPGVGHFEMGMRQLAETGLDDALSAARGDGAAILGVCLGMQLMTVGSEESDLPGLGWFQVETRRFPSRTSAGEKVLIPHMGWNIVSTNAAHSVNQPCVSDGRFYFVHSYYVDAAGTDACLATSQYAGIEFASGIGMANVQGVQFHPEKSHRFGIALFEKFVRD